MCNRKENNVFSKQMNIIINNNINQQQQKLHNNAKINQQKNKHRNNNKGQEILQINLKNYNQ